jgi:hypothetical protein
MEEVLAMEASSEEALVVDETLANSLAGAHRH